MATQKMDGAGSYAAMAGVNLTGKLHYLAKVDTDGRIILGTAGAPVLGQIYQEADVNYPVTVQTEGNGKCICGAGITAGVRLECDANGKAVTFASGVPFGTALNSGLLNEIIEFAFNK